MAEDSQAGRIYYFCAGAHSYTMAIFLDDYPNTVADKVRIVPYEALSSIGRFAPGAFIFTDFDRLDPGRLSLAQRLYDAVGEQNPALPRLNDPRRALQRFELLRALYAAGLNGFNVYRIPERHEIRHFPVFIRWGSDHRKPLTRLIAHANLLEYTLLHLSPEIRNDPDLMIVEFGNRPSPDRRFRKYSAYRVGDHIYGQHCFTSRNWFIKFSGLEWGDEEIQANSEYVAENPHAERLREYFDVGGIQYGRADYCIVDGRIQMFEINTNPMIIAERGREDLVPYAALHDTAMRTLLAAHPGPDVVLEPNGDRSVDEVHADALSARHDPRAARAGAPPSLASAER
jgi:hypothetical protein